MRLKTARTKREGFVVIVVLCMVIMLSVLLLGFNNKSRANLRSVDEFYRSEQALHCARAGINMAIATARDVPGIHANRSLLRLFSGEKTFPVGKGECSITISAESGKLNVNLLKDKSGKLDRPRIEQLLRLIDLLNLEQAADSRIGYGLVSSIIDWVDSDDKVTYLPFIKRENLGAESSYYGQLKQPYTCKNRPLETIEELLRVKGMTPHILDRMRGCLTVYGDGKINLNSASKLTIESLSEQLDTVLAQLIVDRRKLKPFESVAELMEIPGMTDGVYYAIRRAVTVEPTDQHYHVTSRGNVDRFGRTVVAILRRNTRAKNIDVILYKEL